MISSLRGKLILSHLAVIFVAMTVTILLLLSLVRSYFLTATEQSLIAQAQLIAQALIPDATVITPSKSPYEPAMNALQQQQVGNLSIEVESKELPPDSLPAPYLMESNLAYLNEVSVELSSTLQTEILVLDNRGIVLVASSGDDVGDDLSTETIVSIALGGEEQSTFQIISGEEWLLVTVPILRDEQVNGVVYLSQPLSDVTALLNDFRIRLLLASTAAMPISALIGLVLARTIARPIRSLTVAAGKLSRGDYDSPLGTAGRDELGQLNRTFAAMRDKLQAVEQMRNRFVSDVSHELRTPLTAVKGLAETLRDGAADDPNVRDKFLSSIEDETDRLIRLVNDLLLLSRADSLALQFDHQPIDLAALATTTVEKLHPQAQARGIDLDVEFGAPIPKASADPDRIEQVLVILIDNALKHTPAEGKVRISGEKVVTSPQDPAGSASTPPLPPGTWTVLRVSDTGEGIPANDLPRVFERFYRPDHSRSRDHGGSGLGLSIAKALVEAQGGMIWLESPSPWIHIAKGKPGTTATIALPIA